MGVTNPYGRRGGSAERLAGDPCQHTGDACRQFRVQPVGDVLLADAAGRLALDGCGALVTHRLGRPATAGGGASTTWRSATNP